VGESREIVVKATWDEEARVWVAESDDVPGLITEAESSEALIEKLKVLIPELLEANQCILSGEKFLNVLIDSHRKDRTILEVAA
jgi:predicted RNase H-like HicB family nuclease